MFQNIKTISLGHSFSAVTLLLLLTLSLTSCHTQKQAIGTVTGTRTEQSCFENAVKRSYKYDALQSKVKYSMGKTSLGGKMCLESGKRLCLQVNAPILGFEVARVEASQDSVLIVDKYDKKYAILSLSDLYALEEISGHEMEALECIMLGHIYIPGKGIATNKDFNCLTWSTQQSADGKQEQVNGIYQGKDFVLTYTMDAKGQLVSTSLTVGEKSALWEYASYQEVEKGKWVPTQETITATNANQKSISAGLTLTNPQLEESSWRDFEPSGSYKKVTVKELSEAVKAITK